VGKGYAEGPAAEERFAALERGENGIVSVHPPDRQAVYGATPDDPERHFIGWLEDVDPFESSRRGIGQDHEPRRVKRVIRAA